MFYKRPEYEVLHSLIQHLLQANSLILVATPKPAMRVMWEACFMTSYNIKDLDLLLNELYSRKNHLNKLELSRAHTRQASELHPEL